MLRAQFVIGANNGAVEQGPCAFDSIGMNIAADLLPGNLPGWRMISDEGKGRVGFC